MGAIAPASRLYTRSFVQTQIKENIKAPRRWPLCVEITGTGEFPTQMASDAENVSIWWRHHVMAYCLMASSHYLKQCWLTINEIRWHSYEGNVSLNTHDINPLVVFENFDIWNQNYISHGKINTSLFQALFQLSALHYSDVIRSAMASQITSLVIVYSTVYWGADQRKHKSSASLAFEMGIHRWSVNSPHKGPATQNMFPFDNVIMAVCNDSTISHAVSPLFVFV